MQTYLCSLGYEIWEWLSVGYIPLPSTSSLDVAAKKAFENDFKAKNALMCVLKDSELIKVMSCKTAKEIWEKLQGIHEGDEKIKEAKLQAH